MSSGIRGDSGCPGPGPSGLCSRLTSVRWPSLLVRTESGKTAWRRRPSCTEDVPGADTWRRHRSGLRAGRRALESPPGSRRHRLCRLPLPQQPLPTGHQSPGRRSQLLGPRFLGQLHVLLEIFFFFFFKTQVTQAPRRIQKAGMSKDEQQRPVCSKERLEHSDGHLPVSALSTHVRILKTTPYCEDA